MTKTLYLVNEDPFCKGLWIHGNGVRLSVTAEAMIGRTYAESVQKQHGGHVIEATITVDPAGDPNSNEFFPPERPTRSGFPTRKGGTRQ